MLAFHDDQTIKDRYLTRIRAHRSAGDILQDYGIWENGRGSAVGCTVHGADYFAYERELGIPAATALIKDRIFENLPADKAKAWPEAVLTAINPGTDLLTQVSPHFAMWRLEDPTCGVLHFATHRISTEIQDILRLFYSNCTNVRRWRVAAEAVRQAATNSDKWQDRWAAHEASAAAEAQAARWAAVATEQAVQAHQDALSAAHRWTARSLGAKAQDNFVDSAKLALKAASSWAVATVRWAAVKNARWAEWAARYAAKYDAHWANVSAEQWSKSARWAEEARTNAYVCWSEKLLQMLRAA